MACGSCGKKRQVFNQAVSKAKNNKSSGNLNPRQQRIEQRNLRMQARNDVIDALKNDANR